MSSLANTREEVARLLGKLAGVTVALLPPFDEADRFELQVSTLEALTELTSIAEGANVELSPIDVGRAALRQSAEVKWPLHVTISTSITPITPGLEEGALQSFAIHLVWRLARRGEMEIEHANELLDRWHGARVVV